MTLELDNLTIKLKENNKEIIKQLSLSLAKGEVVALMGPNGSGKSTLAQTIMGHPSYEIKEGKILLDNQDITQSLVEERAKKGLFLSFQHPSEIDGVKLETFLRNSYQAKTGEKISGPSYM